MFATVCFCISLNMITSVLNMYTRDVKKLVNATMRMLLYMTPILWTMETMAIEHPRLVMLLKLNPLYYIVEGYRGCLFFKDIFWHHPTQTMYFWGLVLAMFTIGCILMYKFRSRFIDMM